jgi:serine phosphatase RsbU (regulator of sigma subunit)
MVVNIKTKIWSAVSIVVVIFAYFIYFYFPNQQKEQVLESYNNEAQNLTNTVALGVKIGLDEQNFHGVKLAMDYIKDNPNLVFVAIVQTEEVVDVKGDSVVNESVFQVTPFGYPLLLPISSSDSIIVKESSFESKLLNGKIIIGLSTDEVKAKHAALRAQALIITIGVLLLGISIGYLLARNISSALSIISKHSVKVAGGDLSTQLKMTRKDEIGDLSRTFDQMVMALAEADHQLHEYNEELLTKNEQIEFINNQTQESIRYAQMIQDAFLPRRSDISQAFPDSFVLYTPKNTVSGDFYYYAESKGKFVLGAFDCTGHGVPGGFMSVMGCVLLKQIVYNQGITEPSEILTLMDNGIVDSLHQNEQDSKMRDGMDGALCSFDFENKKLQFAGAFNSLYILRDNEWLITKANRRAIGGGGENTQAFTPHEMDIRDNDLIYIMSDGFVDQFGEETGKKYMIKRFKDFLMSIQDLSLVEQHRRLELEFSDWKGNENQIDDVLVVGVRVSFDN